MSWKIKWPSQWKERIKTGIVENLIANLYDKTEYVIHTRNLKQALNDGLVIKKYIESLS